MIGIRLRNRLCLSDSDKEGPVYVCGLVAEAGGEFEDRDDAINVLANLANPYFQLMAVAANAAVDEPEDLLAFAPPCSSEKEGEFLVQKHSHPRAPVLVVRDLPPTSFIEMHNALDLHESRERLHRAIAHFRIALGHLAFQNWILAAEFLYISAETLAQVVLTRLMQEAGLPLTGQGKHELAQIHGFNPVDEKDRSHLNRLDSWIREQHIFDGNSEMHKRLVRASHGLEHGFMDFATVRGHSNSAAPDAFRLVRRAILREIGLPADSGLFEERFDFPLGDWRPVLELEGTYSDRAIKPGPGLTPETLNQEWPDFHGPNVMPRISRLEDNEDGSRKVSLTMDATMETLSDTQSLKTNETRWIAPSKGRESEIPAEGVTTVILNGNDVTEEWVNGRG